MKKSELQQLIKEEVQKLLKEDTAQELNSDQLIEKLRSELDVIRQRYNGKLSRNTIKDEFNYQIGKV